MPRLLLVKLGAIGDVIMAIPAAHAMHTAGYQVDWVCGSSIAPVLRLFPWINIIEVDERLILLGSTATRIRAIVSLWRVLLRRPSYDLCATLYFDRRYKLLSLPVRAPRKITLSRSDRATQLVPGRPHNSEYTRILLSLLPNGVMDGEQPNAVVPLSVPPEVLPAIALPPSSGRPRIVFVPAGSRNLLRDDTLRRWPLEYYVELAGTLIGLGMEVVLAGGPDDTWAAADFAGLPVLDLIGKLAIAESVTLFDSADLVVSHDTGPLHMAALTRASIVALFGPTSPTVFMPQRSNIIGIWGGEGFACRPCYNASDFAPCAHNGCMYQISPAMVLEQIAMLLTARREGQTLMPRVILPEHTPLVHISIEPAFSAPGTSAS